MQTLCSDSISLPYSMLFFFPGRQALPCRGNWVSQEKFVFDSHYHQLMLLCAEDDPSVPDWMEKRQFMSPRIQRKMIEVNRILLMKQIVTER